MKKTAISIALLVVMGLPMQNYAQTQTNVAVTNNMSQISLVKILKKLEKSNKKGSSVNNFFAFLTDLKIVSSSSGYKVRKSRIST